MTERLITNLAAVPAVAFLSAVGTVIRYRQAGRVTPVVKSEVPSPEARPLKVLFLTRDLPFHGGVARCIHYFAGACDRTRVDVQVATMIDPTEQMVLDFDGLGIKPIHLGDRGYVGPSRRLMRLVREKNIDLIVATTFKTYLVAKLATKAGEGRVVFWQHAMIGIIEGKTRRSVYARLARRDPLLFVSHAVRDANFPPRHDGPEEVIYNGVEDVDNDPANAPYPREKFAELGIPPEAVVVTFVAEFVAWKDHATLIAAMKLLKDRGVNAHLLLIGRGVLMEQLRASADSQCEPSRIHFLGARNDVRRWFGATDIYVHPSRGEGFGLALVEAMLARRAVVAAAAGGIVEYVFPDVTGELFRTGDASELADKIAELAADPARARRLGEAAREHCLKEFSIDRFASRICDFLEKAAALRRPAAKAEVVRQ